MEYRIKKGHHESWPRTAQYWVKRVSGYFYFTDKAVYNLGDSDQLDWNKMTGISFNPLNPAYNAIMIGWRYVDVGTKYKWWEIAPYFNINGTIVQPTKDKIVRVKENSFVNFEISYDVIKFVVDRKVYEFDVPKHMNRRFWSSFRIQPWFGGNRSAPNDIQLYLNLL